MNYELPTDYDVIILGTGMTECIIAAALSRIGNKVLHLERNDYYSADWAGFHLQSMEKWIDINCGKMESNVPVKDVDVSSLLKEGETTVDLPLTSSTVSHVKNQLFVKDTAPKPPSTQENLQADQPKDGISSSQPAAREMEEEIQTSRSEVDEVSGNDSTCNKEEGVSGVGDIPEEETQSSAVIAGEETQSSAVPVEEETQSSAVSAVEETQSSVVSAVEETQSSAAPAEEETQSSVVSAVEETQSSVVSAVEETQSSAVSAVEETQSPAVSAVEDKMSENEAKEEAKMSKEWFLDSLKKEWRKFNLDLMPKVLYCRGPMVELLTSSDIAKYCEFRAVTRILTLMNGTVHKVPCSRADVFSSKEVSIIEKRMLMKLLSFCLDYDKHPEEYQEFADKPFCEFLSSRKLTANVQHYIEQAIAGSDQTTPTIQGLKKTQRFLKSLGRYGNTAYLWPLYGAGELPQAFCRTCAVFGGVYCLQRSARCMIYNEGKVIGIVDTEGQRLNSRYLIMEASYAAPTTQPTSSGYSRGILLTNKSLLPAESEQISLLHIPSGNSRIGVVTLMELSSLSLACPPDLYVVHLSCDQDTEAEADLLPVISSLFNFPAVNETEDKPEVLWSLFFNMADSSGQEKLENDGSGLYIVSGPNRDLDFDASIEKAKMIFNQICPGEEFLPKAPNPEDIIIEGEGAEGASGGPSFSDTDSQADDPNDVEVVATTTEEIITTKEVTESPMEVVIYETDVVKSSVKEVSSASECKPEWV